MQDGLQRVEPEGAVHQDRESTQSATGDRRQDVAEDGEVVLGVVETCSHLTPFPRMLFPSTGWKSDQALSSDWFGSPHLHWIRYADERSSFAQH